MNNKLIKILNYTGIILFIITSFIFFQRKISYEYICLLFLLSSFLLLPDSILFTIRMYKQEKRFGIYWISKLLGLIIAIIIFLVGFIVISSKELS